MENRKPYPADVSGEEWAFVAPYFTLMTEDTPQREYSLREVFNVTRRSPDPRTGARAGSLIRQRLYPAELQAEACRARACPPGTAWSPVSYPDGSTSASTQRVG
jgi:hypothetical protein